MVQTTPAPDAPEFGGDDRLVGVDCVSATSCTSVGFHGAADFPRTALLSLAEHWDGSSWTIQNTPNVMEPSPSPLSGISCASAGQCSVVGSANDEGGQPEFFAERGTGSSWQIENVPQPAGSEFNELAGVSCPSAGFCLAVGLTSSGPSSAVRRGGRWSLASMRVPKRSKAGVSGVSCVSPKDCTAVGHYFDANSNDHFLAEHWNGVAWSIESAPLPPGADRINTGGVSCAHIFCMATGYITTVSSSDAFPFSEMWNGSSWSVQTMPNPGAEGSLIRSVSCSAADACTAVGNNNGGGTVVERWDGSTWTVQPSPNAPSGISGLSGVSCPAADFCVAVGGVGQSSSQVPLGEHWNGVKWIVDPTPTSGTGQGELSSVSCTSTASCVAAGDTGTNSTDEPLIESYLRAARPEVITGAADAVGRHSAVLHGTVNPEASGVTDCEFQISAGHVRHAVRCGLAVGSGTGAVAVSARVTGLTPGLRYGYRLMATNFAGTGRGAIRTFSPGSH
jgi:hypothetical protein